MPALIYQLVWQRAILRWIGMDIASITVVVSIFVLGLGLGALLGGKISRSESIHPVAQFVVLECLIAVFGFHSASVGSVCLH